MNKLERRIRRGHTWVDVSSGTDSSPVQLHAGEYGLVYSNTITNGSLLESLAYLDCPVICHVHELEYCMKYLTAPGNTESIRRHTNHYVAVSEAVRKNIVKEMGVSDEKIELVHEFIPALPNLKPDRVSKARKCLGVPDNAIIVGASGTTDWRKGPDVFVQLASAVRRRMPERPIHFVWVGGEKSGPNFGALWYDVQHLALEDVVHFIGHQKHPLELFSLFDVFALTSREDPYPLVNLEAASLMKPIVCFDGSGGAPEFVEDDCGFVVPYLDVKTMAEKVAELVEKPELRQRMGQRGAQKVRERHNVDIAAPIVARLIGRLMH
jgi:glycosyltransferase involved in cell wall biosynthesis